MSKEIEAFLEKRIIDINNYLKNNERSENDKNFPPVYELQICKLAKRMLDIENANPSKALKESEEIVEYITEDKKVKYKSTILFDCKIIKQYILKSQEQEKVLEIIFEKKVDIIYLKDSNNVDEYNSHFGCVVCKLTKEEFDLLKRWTNGNISSNSTNM